MSITCGEIFEQMQTRFQAAEAGDWETTIQFLIDGDGGGEWTIEIGEGRCQVRDGKAEEVKATVSTSAETWIGCVTGEVNPQMAFMTGKIKVAGDMALAMKLGSVLG